MYDVSGKNHLVVNQYRLILWDEIITLYNIHHIKKENGLVYIHFFQNKTEPLIIDEKDIVNIFKEKIDRSVIL